MAQKNSLFNIRFDRIFSSETLSFFLVQLLRHQGKSFEWKNNQVQKVNLLNIEINNVLTTEVLENLKYGTVFTPNVDHIMKLQNDREFLEAYKTADYKLCDSQILIYASRFLGQPIQEKISGSDFFPAFYNFHKQNETIKIFLLGAAQGVAIKAQEKINAKVHRNIIVSSYSPPFGFEKKEAECRKIVEMINSSDATVLAVGLGAPKQEKWIYKYKNQLPNIKIFLAIGATIDFEAGNIQRAPKYISNMGFEWLYRMVSEPQRLWKRYLIEGLPFFWLILQQKFQINKITNNPGS
ncbi:MAG: WecB/TagA/CpsF family glycosyltransferase [Nostoc sp. DedQUE04]|uniref:WecB/TagA/CpsF family glycosyltransferase n=1 Tax=Nostoc sp. DedQUE04 TaxID=3075390 RepID=UPI002AD4E918|nr:WecB/TagA/CpsF family glycosyltransferase [Nostoc sp. DedQUE04]MDZ8137908.1 WecB/TagA/CpsF family glycosyltransferase [Nostoc sp. DedQUE04]